MLFVKANIQQFEWSGRTSPKRSVVVFCLDEGLYLATHGNWRRYEDF